MRPTRAPGRAGSRPVRPRGRARCVCVLIVAAGGERVLGVRTPRRDGAVQSVAPPSHASPEDGAPRGRHG
eukprot:7300003-Prymnesium_polylepis.1